MGSLNQGVGQTTSLGRWRLIGGVTVVLLLIAAGVFFGLGRMAQQKSQQLAVVQQKIRQQAALHALWRDAFQQLHTVTVSLSRESVDWSDLANRLEKTVVHMQQATAESGLEVQGGDLRLMEELLTGLTASKSRLMAEMIADKGSPQRLDERRQQLETALGNHDLEAVKIPVLAIAELRAALEIMGHQPTRIQVDDLFLKARLALGKSHVGDPLQREIKQALTGHQTVWQQGLSLGGYDRIALVESGERLQNILDHWMVPRLYVDFLRLVNDEKNLMLTQGEGHQEMDRFEQSLGILQQHLNGDFPVDRQELLAHYRQEVLSAYIRKKAEHALRRWVMEQLRPLEMEISQRLAQVGLGPVWNHVVGVGLMV